MKLRHALTLTALAVGIAGPALASHSATDDCDVVLYGPQNGVHSGGSGYDATLWPPNHKMTTVALESTNTDMNCDVNITGVFQDEALDEPGSGNTTEFDAANCRNGGNVSTVDLRAERSGRGTGRFYQVDYEASDVMAGHTETGSFLILVPHDQRRDQSNWENELESAEDDMRVASLGAAACSTEVDGSVDDADETSNPANGGGDDKAGQNKGGKK